MFVVVGVGACAAIAVGGSIVLAGWRGFGDDAALSAIPFGKYSKWVSGLFFGS